MRVAVIGQGYVGLTISVGALTAGHSVVGVDHSASVVDGLRRGHSHIEGISGAEFGSGIRAGLFYPTTTYDEITSAEVVVIAVPTPLDSAGKIGRAHV